MKGAIMKLWRLHVAEQMILDDEEVNPDKYKDGKFFESTDEFDEENSVEYTKVQYKKAVLPKMILKTNVKELDMDAARAKRQVVHTQAKVIADQDAMYKYISKNMLFVATVSPKATGPIGSATPEEASLVVSLVDTVTGRILHCVTHPASQAPIHAVFSENWVIYHYFNLRAHRYQMSVVEIYDESRADNKDVLKLIVGKHNLTSPISSYSRPEVLLKSQSYYFTHSVKTMAVTATAKGITSKQILVGTIGDQVPLINVFWTLHQRTKYQVFLDF